VLTDRFEAPNISLGHGERQHVEPAQCLSAVGASAATVARVRGAFAAAAARYDPIIAPSGEGLSRASAARLPAPTEAEAEGSRYVEDRYRSTFRARRRDARFASNRWPRRLCVNPTK